jgi:hypothetical protein
MTHAAAEKQEPGAPPPESARYAEWRLSEFLRLYRILPGDRREEAFRFWRETAKHGA